MSDEITQEELEEIIEQKRMEWNEEVQESINQKVDDLVAEKLAQASNSAAFKAITLGYDTPEGKLPELTFLPKRFIFRLTSMAMMDEWHSPTHKVGTCSAVWRTYLYKHMRSLDGAHLDKLRNIAETETNRPLEQGITNTMEGI